MQTYPATVPVRSAFPLASLRRLRRVEAAQYVFQTYPTPAVVQSLQPVHSATPAVRPQVRLAQAAGLAVIGGFVLLIWLRAESFMHMMPQLVDLGLGVLAGVIGNSLGYWFGLLGITSAPACAASHTLKMLHIVGVPLAYVLLGGHMLLMPLTGALIAAALVLITHRLGWTCRTKAAS